MKKPKLDKSNPLDFCLTVVQADVLQIIAKRTKAGRITTRMDISEALGGKDKSWTCRILRALIDKGLVERYEQRYYKLKW
jgi:predicted transcriptional regulator